MDCQLQERRSKFSYRTHWNCGAWLQPCQKITLNDQASALPKAPLQTSRASSLPKPQPTRAHSHITPHSPRQQIQTPAPRQRNPSLYFSVSQRFLRNPFAQTHRRRSGLVFSCTFKKIRTAAARQFRLNPHLRGSACRRAKAGHFPHRC